MQSTTALDMSMDFIHKSFREYFLAEYYLESILNNKGHYLNVGLPSSETILFLDDLLELLLDNKNENLKEYANILTKSLLSQTNQQDNLSQSDITQTLWKNAQRYYEDEQIIFKTEHYESNKIWFIADFPISKYAELWIHRWLSLYILNKLAPDTRIDKNKLADFIVKTSHTLPQLQMRLNKVDLSNQFLGNTRVSGADLSDANLFYASLSGASLPAANLSNASLSNADLTGASLPAADLSNASLSNADLTGANLSGANLSGANLSDAILSHANLSGADLSDANLTGADLSYLRRDNRTNFENAKLTSAYPPSIVTDITTRSIGKESNVKSERSIHRITRYTSDGKPVNQ